MGRSWTREPWLRICCCRAAVERRRLLAANTPRWPCSRRHDKRSQTRYKIHVDRGTARQVVYPCIGGVHQLEGWCAGACWARSGVAAAWGARPTRRSHSGSGTGTGEPRRAPRGERHAPCRQVTVEYRATTAAAAKQRRARGALVGGNSGRYGHKSTVPQLPIRARATAAPARRPGGVLTFPGISGACAGREDAQSARTGRAKPSAIAR